VNTSRALLFVPAALLSATLSVAVPGWDIELTGLEEHAQTQRLTPEEKQPPSPRPPGLVV